MKRLDYVGHASKWDNIVVHGDLSKPEFLAYYVKDGAVAAAAGLGRDQDTAALVELFTQQRTWRARRAWRRSTSCSETSELSPLFPAIIIQAVVKA